MITCIYKISSNLQKERLLQNKLAKLNHQSTFGSPYTCSQNELSLIINSRFTLIEDNGNLTVNFQNHKLDTIIKTTSDIANTITNYEDIHNKQLQEKELEAKAEKTKSEAKQLIEKENRSQMENWIKSHGSKYLLNCLKFNINCKETYLRNITEEILKDIHNSIDNVYTKDDSIDYNYETNIADPYETTLNLFIEINDKFPQIDSQIVFIPKDDSNYEKEAILLNLPIPTLLIIKN